MLADGMVDNLSAPYSLCLDQAINIIMTISTDIDISICYLTLCNSPITFWALGLRMNLFAFPKMAISKAFPALSAKSSSSSPSSLARSMTAGEAPWKSAQGMRRRLDNASVRSDQPPVTR